MLAKFNTDININFLGQNMWSGKFSEFHKRQFSNHIKYLETIYSKNIPQFKLNKL